MDKLWKARERKAAQALGGQRAHLPGKSSPDVVSDFYIAEVKTRGHLPAWITTGLAKARRRATNSQLGVLILHEKGKHDDLIVLSLKDFRYHFGK